MLQINTLVLCTAHTVYGDSVSAVAYWLESARCLAVRLALCL